jgi:hypothetical protein
VAISQWDVPIDLLTPEGTLRFNEATGVPFTSSDYYYFLLQSRACNAAPAPLRFSADPIPQDDGEIIRRTFKPGYTVNLAVELWTLKQDTAPACDADLTVMWDTLLLHVNALVNPEVEDLYTGQCRLHASLPGVAERTFDKVRLSEWPVSSFDGPELAAVNVATFQLQTEYPYAIDSAEVLSPKRLNVGDTITFTNRGTHRMYPVFRVYGPYTEFTLLNNTTGKYITYFNGLPGASSVAAGHFIEIDTWRNSVYLDATAASRKPGIDFANSDFFPLEPGDNALQFGAIGGSGATHVDVLWQAAWA